MGWGRPDNTITLHAKLVIACPLLIIGSGCTELEHEFRAEANAQLPLIAEEEKEIRDALRKQVEEAAKTFMENHHE